MQENSRVICNRDRSFVALIIVTPALGPAPASCDHDVRLLCKHRLAGNDSVAPDCNHHITRRGHKMVGGDNTTRDNDAVIAVITDQDNFHKQRSASNNGTS